MDFQARLNRVQDNALDLVRLTHRVQKARGQGDPDYERLLVEFAQRIEELGRNRADAAVLVSTLCQFVLVLAHGVAESDQATVAEEIDAIEEGLRQQRLG